MSRTARRCGLPLHAAAPRDRARREDRVLRRRCASPPAAASTSSRPTTSCTSESVFVTERRRRRRARSRARPLLGRRDCCWYSTDTATCRRAGPLPRSCTSGRLRLTSTPDLDHDGTQEVITRDDRFSYAFASFADSRWPVRDPAPPGLWGSPSRRPRTRARSAATRTRSGMRRWNPKRKTSNQGIVAAWAADECHGRPRGSCVQDDRPALAQRQDPRRAHGGSRSSGSCAASCARPATWPS